LYNTNTNTERYATSDMADASKTATVEQRAEKKAARRAAFIQEVAEAVALKVCGPGRESSGPFAEAYKEQNMVAWRASKVYEDKLNGLHWAVEQGLLPEGSTQLPSEELQRHLLQAHKAQGI
jgi:hypothetical protein